MTIQGAEGMSPGDIRDEINRGGRLVIYIYCVSILVMTFKRSAGIRLIKAGHSPAASSWPYLLLSLVAGWWGFPWGPIYTIECLYRNLCGGIDVTEAAMRELQPSDTSTRAAAPAVSPVPAATTFTIHPSPAKKHGINLTVAGLMVAAVCVIVATGISIYCYNKQQALTIVLASGIDQPYSVRVNGQPYLLPPYGTKMLEMPEGEFVIEDTDGSKIVGGKQTVTFTQPFFSHLNTSHVGIINPDGAAILVESQVPYYSDGTTPPENETPAISLLANHQSYFIERPDYVIVPAEQRISMPRGTTRLVKTRLENLAHPDLSYLIDTLTKQSGYSAVRDHLMLLAKYRADEDLLSAASRALTPEDTQKFFHLRLDERPVLVDWHRAYQSVTETQLPEHDLIQEYRAYLKADPDNGALMYLLGRQYLPRAEQTQLFTRALAAKTPCYYAHSAMGYDALCEGQFAEGLKHYESSIKAGVTTSSIKYYYRQALLAAGQTKELLAVIAAERKKEPLNLLLADEEIRAAYAGHQDKAAAIKTKDAYLAVYKANHASAKALADSEAYLQATIAYLTGELPVYAQAISRFDFPFYRFRAALTNGDLSAAAQALPAPPKADPSGQLLLYLLAARKRDSATAEHHFQVALEAMRTNDQAFRQIASLLSTEKPDAKLICDVRMNVESKRVLLTALGVHQSAEQSAYFNLARKLNFNREFPYHFLRSILTE